ncbi:hypothetical protein D3C77_482640 [compost metagenome]
MLLGGDGNLCIAFTHLRDRTGDLGQGGTGFLGLLNAIVSLERAFLHEIHCIAGACLQRRNHGGDFIGGGLHTLGQVAHLIGDDGKATTQVASTGSFDGRVEGQQVGLLGNAVNHADHTVDLLAVLGQLANHFGGLLHAAGQSGNRSLHAADHFLAAAGQGVGGLRQVAGGAGMLGDVIDRGRHLVDRGGGLIGFALLAEHAVAHVVHARGQARGTGVELGGSTRHGVDHAVIGGLHGVEGAGHLPDLIATGQGHPG